VFLVQVSLLLIGQQGLIDFFRYRPLLPIGCANFTPTPEENYYTVQRQLLIVQYKHQANKLLSMNNFTPLVISRNDKIKQLTLLSQRKPALTARNLKNQPRR
jgi:hypothetical protein